MRTYRLVEIYGQCMHMNRWTRPIISIFALVALSSLISGVPAWPGLHTFQQPDGTTFSGHQRGDESGAWFETENGYIVKQSTSDGWYDYVQKSASGSNSPASTPQSIDLRIGYADPESIGAMRQSAMRQTDLSSTVSASKSANKDVLELTELPNQFRSAPPFFAPPPTGAHNVIVILVQFNGTVHNSSHTTAYFQNLLFNASNPYSMNSYFREVSYGQLNVTGTVVGWYNSSHSLSFYGADNGSDIDALNGDRKSV